MTPIAIQVSTSKGKVKGQAYSSHVGEGGLSVLQTFVIGHMKSFPFIFTSIYLITYYSNKKILYGDVNGIYFSLRLNIWIGRYFSTLLNKWKDGTQDEASIYRFVSTLNHSK